MVYIMSILASVLMRQEDESTAVNSVQRVQGFRRGRDREGAERPSGSFVSLPTFARQDGIAGGQQEQAFHHIEVIPQVERQKMKEWAVLAESMKGISTFGKAAELTAHNAFVRINTNRALAGMPALESAPVYTSDVPEVDYDDFWVTPDRIIFVGLNQPSEHHRLVVKMSQTTSTGVSSGWNNIVIITPAFSPDWGDADITAVNSEIVAVRKENEELKASVDRLCTENSQLKDEVRQLREQVAKARR